MFWPSSIAQKANKVKLIWRLFAAISAALIAIFFWNYATVGKPVASRLAQDSRNAKVTVWAYHRYGLMPSSLVIDLRRVDGEASTVDVLRALFQSAESLKDSKFDHIVLAHRGKPKLIVDGTHFNEIGLAFKTQNPIYIMRMLPQNIRRLDGSVAYGSWSGGFLGVLNKQMEDVRKFSEDWYLNDLAQDVSH